MGTTADKDNKKVVQGSSIWSIFFLKLCSSVRPYTVYYYEIDQQITISAGLNVNVCPPFYGRKPWKEP